MKTRKQPSLLPGDPNSEFASADVGEERDDSDVDVDGLLELDSKGEVVTGFYGKVLMLCCVVWYEVVSIAEKERLPPLGGQADGNQAALRYIAW